MIGQRQQFNAIARSTIGDFARGEQAIGSRGMTMEVDVGHERKRGGDLRKPRMIAQQAARLAQRLAGNHPIWDCR